MEESLNQFFSDPRTLWLLVAIAIWTFPWKGVALWRAAKNGSIKWFVVLLLLNTLAILDILYIFVFSKKSENNN